MLKQFGDRKELTCYAALIEGLTGVWNAAVRAAVVTRLRASGLPPDDLLLSLAAKGELSKPDVLEAQARRMLADPRSQALADNFMGQWLQLRGLATHTPDAKKFPTFTPTLRAAMKQELALFATKVDVAEELSRLSTHVAEVRRVLAAGGSVGKRLDFLMQELHREANTLGSKSVDAELSQAALEIKVLIEQMREQVQNLE